MVDAKSTGAVRWVDLVSAWARRGGPAGSAPLEGKSPSDRMRPQGNDNYQKHRRYRPPSAFSVDRSLVGKA
jgi:hypothetical protein